MLDVIELPYGMQMLCPFTALKAPTVLPSRRRHDEADLILRKGRELNIDSYSAFCAADNETKTGLAGCLRERGITDVWVCGLALDYCVSFTAIDAAREGFDTHVITDASAAIDANGSLEKAEAAWRLAASTCAWPRMYSSQSTDETKRTNIKWPPCLTTRTAFFVC